MSSFQNLFLQINKVKNIRELTETELKHVPVIKVPEDLKAGEPFELHVTVGRKEHPMENDHHIQFLDLFVNEVYLTRLTFIPVVMKPEATVTVILKHPGLLRAVSRCNLHGQWEGNVELQMEEESPPQLR